MTHMHKRTGLILSVALPILLAGLAIFALGRGNNAAMVSVAQPETLSPVNSYVRPYPTAETDWRRTQGDHTAWEWEDGYNGVANDFAPAPPNDGASIRAERTVLPMAGGKVVKVNSGQYWLAVDHGNGDIGFYLHVANIKVHEGDNVTANTARGNPSSLGFNATGVHVHVAIAKYALSAPPRVGDWNPNASWWARSFPGFGNR